MEAYRVLRPGGRIILADMHRNNIQNGTFPSRIKKAFNRRMAHIPTTNLWDVDAYFRYFEGAGFVGVTVESISDHVWRPFMKATWAMSAVSAAPDKVMVENMMRKIEGLSAGELFWKKNFDIDEYSLIFARKH